MFNVNRNLNSVSALQGFIIQNQLTYLHPLTLHRSLWPALAIMNSTLSHLLCISSLNLKPQLFLSLKTPLPLYLSSLHLS